MNEILLKLTLIGTGFFPLKQSNYSSFVLKLQSLEAALKTVPKDRNGKLSKEYLRMALDAVGPSAGLPPYGALEEVLLMNKQSCIVI